MPAMAMDPAVTPSPSPTEITAGRRITTSRQATRQQHLYLLLDDTKSGFGIHKVDIDDDVDGTTTPAERLPKPPLLRIEYPTLGDYPSFAVLGSNIIGMGFASTPSTRSNRRSEGVTLAFDTKTTALAVMRDLPYDVYPEIAVAAANRPYMIDSCSSMDDDELCVGSLHCLKLQEDTDRSSSGWNWWTESDFCESTPRWLWSGRQHWLPLSPHGIRAHALHPGGRAFFVSVHCWIYRDHRGRGTFSYDTESDEWTRYGNWELPFAGQAHYDAKLGAWIGLHVRDQSNNPDGYLCACNIPRLGRLAAPHCKVCKDQLFPVGGGRRFCLVEILTREGVDTEGCLGDGDKCMLRLTTFRVRRGEGGALTITIRRRAGVYKLSRYVDMFQAQAFWM